MTLGILHPLLAALTSLGDVGTPPPGTVPIPGGNTRIGLEVKEFERRLESDANSERYAASLSAETPRFSMPVSAFYLMVTEVTNEQYAEYVKRGGGRPPAHWAEAALRNGRDAYFQDQERAKAAARAGGKPLPELPPFDAHDWWAKNWSVSAWQVPAGDELRPVVFVTYAEARAYARWAGMRLPTEFEYQRAVRGDSAQDYPWGNDWDPERYAATSMLKKKGSSHDVGSFPAGASRQGVFDLAGNVWEWTSSPYTPYPGYEARVYEFGYGSLKRQVNALGDWNPAQRVLVGGSFQNSNLMARATTRRAADITQATDAVGFRCAASPRPGVDLSNLLLDDDLAPNVRPRDARGTVEYAPDSTTAVQAWSTAALDPDQPRPPGYAVIESYHHVLFTPVKSVPATEMVPLERLCAREGPVHIGFLSTSVRLAEPALAPGNYLVSWRPKGMRAFAGNDAPKIADVTPAAAPNDARSRVPIEEALKLDIETDHVIFTSTAGVPVCALRGSMEYGPLRESSVAVSDSASGLPTDAPERQDGARAKLVRFDLSIACRTTKKGFNLVLPLTITAEEIEKIRGM